MQIFTGTPLIKSTPARLGRPILSCTSPLTLAAFCTTKVHILTVYSSFMHSPRYFLGDFYDFCVFLCRFLIEYARAVPSPHHNIYIPRTRWGSGVPACQPPPRLRNGKPSSRPYLPTSPILFRSRSLSHVRVGGCAGICARQSIACVCAGLTFARVRRAELFR